MSQDKEFEKYLQGGSALSKLYTELPDAELPTHLDASILAEAHRAVYSHPGEKSKRRWTIPLGMVATLFLAVMIGLQVPYMLKEAASPQQRQEEKITAMMDTSITGQTNAPPELQKSQETARTLPQKKYEVIRAEPAMDAVKAVAPFSSGTSVSPQTAIVSGRISSNSASVAPAASIAAPVPLAEKPLGLSGAGYTDQAKVLAKEKNESGLVHDNYSDALVQQAPAAAMMSAPQPVQLKRALKDETSEIKLTPEDWLKKIKRLMADGKLDEAKKEMAAFKKRYPDHPVPANLEIK